MTRVLIIPAAGTGSRLKASTAKALVPVAGRPMIDHLLDLCAAYVQHVVVVTHPLFAESMRQHLGRTRAVRVDSQVVEQAVPTGMLDAILLGTPEVARVNPDRVWTIWCDQVGVLPDTLARLAAADARDAAPALVFPTVRQEPPYIHFWRGADGRIAGVLQRREHDDLPPVGESDMGVFSLSRDAYLRDLQAFDQEAATGAGTGERNFLPFIPWLAARGQVETIAATDPREATGINTPDDLRDVEAWLLSRSSQP
jgi:bifunctional UDP-N-acetylglucosamine pyrophosphorylase / glucosamine-1-phosphate N-acetyltransferase